MKKTELLAYGIHEDKVSAFQEVYWADVKKQAVRMVEADKEQETAPSPSAIREAITAMVRLIPDPVRLSLILANVNRHYQSMKNNQAGKGASGCP